ncbi:protein lifeguard 1-like isoform X2 [Apostichopus japonicus]
MSYEGDNGFTFEDVNVKHGFLRKVYGILTIQLTITVGIIIAIYIPTADNYPNYFIENTWVFWLCFCFTFVMILALACVPDLRRNSPINIICLMLFTIAEGVLLGITCSTYEAQTVLIAAGACAGIVLILTLFAFQTKIDFTMMSGLALVLVTVLFFFGLFAIIFRNDVLDVVYCSLGVGVFSLYIVIDTQLMLGGKHQYEINEEEYVFAALNLYLDIINLFLFLLRIVNKASN